MFHLFMALVRRFVDDESIAVWHGLSCSDSGEGNTVAVEL